MLNKIIIAALLVFAGNCFAQSIGTTIRGIPNPFPQFGSGYIYKFNTDSVLSDNDLIQIGYTEALYITDVPKLKSKLKYIMNINIEGDDTVSNSLKENKYFNYKRLAAERLKQIYFKEKDYNTALKYFDIETGTYRGEYLRCGYSGMEEEFARNTILSYHYENIGNINDAFAVISYYILNYYDGMNYTDEHPRMVNLLKKVYGSNEVKIMFQNAIDSMYPDHGHVYINFLNRRYIVWANDAEIRSIDREIYKNQITMVQGIEKYKAAIRNNRVYKLIMEE